MKQLPACAMALVLTIAAAVAAGCGGSGRAQDKPASNPPPAAAGKPAPSTSATGDVTASTLITSPAYRTLLIKGEQQATGKKFTNAQLSQLADCAIKKLQTQGVKTVGDALGHQPEFRNLGAQCAAELGIQPSS